jgi:hypothetical protein
MTDDELLLALKRLVSVLEDPHPGLSSWIEARDRLAVEVKNELVLRLPPEKSDA